MIRLAIQQPGLQLIACGNFPDAAWLEWVATTDKPLTPDMFHWRTLVLADRGIAPLCAGRVHTRCTGQYNPDTWEPAGDETCVCTCHAPEAGR